MEAEKQKKSMYEIARPKRPIEKQSKYRLYTTTGRVLGLWSPLQNIELCLQCNEWLSYSAVVVRCENESNTCRTRPPIASKDQRSTSDYHVQLPSEASPRSSKACIIQYIALPVSSAIALPVSSAIRQSVVLTPYSTHSLSRSDHKTRSKNTWQWLENASLLLLKQQSIVVFLHEREGALSLHVCFQNSPF